nr:high mobility group B protein 10 [Ipomoea batatas]
MSSNPSPTGTALTAPASGQSKRPLSYPKPQAEFQEIVRNPQLFWQMLQAFHVSLGAKYLVPTVAGKPLDLHRLFVEVTVRGGIEKVIRDRRWEDVIGAFIFPSYVTSASFILRKYYLSMLYHFEQVYYFRKEEPSSLRDPTDKTFGALETGHPIDGDATVNPLSGAPSIEVGDSVVGTIDAKFDYGYVISVNMGPEIFNGALYHKPMQPDSSQSASTSTGPAKLNRKKHQLALTDPSRPRQNLSGYNFFFAEHYARLKPAHQGHVRAISKEIGMLWSRLSEAEKQVYQEKGLRDKERYRTEMLEYKSSQPVQIQ